MDILASIKSALAPPHKAGYPFIAGGLAAFLLGLLFWHILAWLGLIFTLFCLYFFRDPERVPPPRPTAILAPADGLVVLIDTALPPPELEMPAIPLPRIAIFLSVLDVHVNRIPLAGTIQKIAYRPGKFLNAADDKASDENERNALRIRIPDGRDLAVVQIAGLIARRILCEVVPGERVTTGARFGIIRFGSRTDIYLPENTIPLIAVGQRMTGGETVLAELPLIPSPSPP
jgi:phosphatidylserine decarboxylase